MDQVRDIRELLPALKIKTIFDVGANVGRTVRALRKAYRSADIYAFEPVEGTFQLLQSAIGSDSRTKCFRVALGDEKAVVKMESTPGSVKNKIGARGLDVEVDQGDNFCAVHGIDTINFLKIDTEGYDLKVCKGFAAMIAAQRIDLLQVEAGLNPKNTLHVPLQAFREYLEPLGYNIFRLYDQAGQPVARRCDAVFVSSTIAQQNRKSTQKTAGAESWI